MSTREEKAERYFNCTTRERAVFEAGIKLGTVYHQFIGAPVSDSNVESLERAIEEGVRVQPFVEDAKVSIDRDHIKKKKNQYDYQSLTGHLLNMSVVIHIENVRVTAQMRYIEELHYPLMFVKEIEEL